MQRLERQNEWVIDYVPHEGQTQFHLDRYKWRFRLLSGGTGSGKTVAGAFEMTDYLLENAGAVGYVFEPTYPMVKKNLIKDCFEKLFGVPIEGNYFVEEFNKTDSFIQLRNGSRLWFGSLDRPESAEGANVDFIMVDEARLIPKFEEAWNSMLRRLRGSVPGKFWNGGYVTTTPNFPKSFMHTFFENPKTKDPAAKVYRMSLYDNPFAGEEYVKSIERRHKGGLAERFLFGRFAAVGVGTIPFDASVHVKQLGPKEYKEICYGVDFGWTNPSCILVVAFDGDGVAYVLDEFYQKQTPHTKLVEEAKELKEKYGYGKFFCDRSEPETIELFNSRGLRAEGSPARRDESIREMSGRFSFSETVKSRIYVDEQCVNLIEELQIYDEKVKENDHAVDALRYVLASKMKISGPVDDFLMG